MMDEAHGIADILLEMGPEIAEELRIGFWGSNTNDVKFGENKQDVASELDHKIGQWVAKKILGKFQNVRIDSEEVEERVEGSDFVLKIHPIVRIDPIDGSKHFVAGIQLFTSIFALSYKGETVFSMILDPIAYKRYWAFKGEGAFLNGKKIHVNDLKIADSFVMHEQPTSKLYRDHPEKFEYNMKIMGGLAREAFRLRNLGNSGLAAGLVAEGAASAFIDLSGTAKLYDIEGPVLLLKEAGAIISNLKGELVEGIHIDEETSEKYLIDTLICANPIAYKEILEISQQNSI